MKPELSDDTLLASDVPAAWRPLLEHIRQFEKLSRIKPTEEKLSSANRDRAAELRKKILAEASQWRERAPSTLQAGSQHLRRWFTEAVLLWLWFGESCGKVVVDTLGSTTLSRFPVDFEPTSEQRAAVKQALRKAFDWSEAEFAQIEADIARLLTNLWVKQSMTGAMGKTITSGGPSQQDKRIIELMTNIYGEVPFRPGDVELVITTTTLFFCVKSTDTGLTVEDFSSRPPAEQKRVAAFLDLVRTSVMNIKNVRFPAFGLFDPDKVSATWLQSMVAAARGREQLAQVDERVILKTLRSMTLIIPAADAEKFLIHDSWGHGWQESLCEFEWLFHDMDELSVPLAPRELGKAIVSDNGRAAIDEKALYSVVETDLRKRLRIGLNLVMAECLADLMEYKFARMCEPLPSSSIVPTATLKLDMSTQDARRMRSLWRKAYTGLVDSDEMRKQLRSELSELGVPSARLDEALQKAGHLAIDRFASVLTVDGPEAASSSDREVCTIVHRMALGVSFLDSALTQFIDDGFATYEAAGGPRWRCPQACIDLIAVTLGWVYERNHAVNVWHLDELLQDGLAPMMQALSDALAS